MADASHTHSDDPSPTASAASTSLVSLRSMIHGTLTYTPSQMQPGKYLAIDCEMVGVGIGGSESSLARVSLINWYGAVQLDVFVRQKEQVVDYRTQWSGIRGKDMIGAKPFEEVQKQVADLIKDRILIGHAIHNDLKALLLSHPRPMLRDTQIYAHKFKLTKSKRIALRNLVKDQIGITIQEGEHNSVTDARATMAVYRLHKKEWEKGSRPIAVPPAPSINDSTKPDSNPTKKRKRDFVKGKERQPPHDDASAGFDFDSDSPSSDNEESTSPSTKPLAPTSTKITTPPKKQKTQKPNQKQKQKRHNPSSGLSTVVKRRSGSDESGVSKTVLSRRKVTSVLTSKGSSGSEVGNKAWWTKLPSSGLGSGSEPGNGGGRKKGSIRVNMAS
ncbi:hypothetical protein D9756_005160 [Leucocoprinus leucothites]|uniref:RNA exonuclease 4 n=1 Tax=Leucocoprinus leucothites TaxID=201217 RepID=A0A8H5G9U4_9AGAR|nr:hypothetical protein D9756_005160 [Leucoagaricus leucothites]